MAHPAAKVHEPQEAVDSLLRTSGPVRTAAVFVKRAVVDSSLSSAVKDTPAKSIRPVLKPSKSIAFKQTAECRVYDPDEPPIYSSDLGNGESVNQSMAATNTYTSLLSGERRKRSRSYLEEESYKRADTVLQEINELILALSRNSNTERQRWFSVYAE